MSCPASRGFVSGAGGLRLTYRAWAVPGRCRGTVVLVHGLGEHSGRYDDLAVLLGGHGFGLFGFDLRGHGRSEGPRGHVNAWEDYLEDLTAVLRAARRERSGLARFLFGHSMGAIVALDYASRWPSGWRGVVVSGTPLRPGDPARPARIRLARWLSSVWPRCPIPVGIAPEALSQRPEVVRAYREDPLVFGRATARWGTEFLDAITRVDQAAEDFRVPLLMVHGSADPIARVDGVREWYGRVPQPDKALRVYEGARHEPHNDVVRRKVADDLATWLSAHLQ